MPTLNCGPPGAGSGKAVEGRWMGLLSIVLLAPGWRVWTPVWRLKCKRAGSVLHALEDCFGDDEVQWGGDLDIGALALIDDDPVPHKLNHAGAVGDDGG